MRTVKPGVEVIGQFSVVSIEDGYTKISGLSSFSTSIWKDGIVQSIPITITEISSSGEYSYAFTPDNLGYWKVEVLIDYSKDLFGFEFICELGSVTDIYEVILRIAGLSHENIFIDETVYDSSGQLVEARVRIFDSGDNCLLATDGGNETVGLLGTYDLQSVWESVNKFKTFRQVLNP